MNNFVKWAESKQGMIVLGITAVLAVAIYIIRHGSGAVVAANNGGVTNMSAVPTGPMYTITNPPVSTPSGPGNPTPIQPNLVGPPTSIGGQLGKVRAAIAGDPYDQQYGGVYLFSTPATVAGGGSTTTTVPFGSTIQILSTATGVPYGGPGRGGSSTYYLTPQGYISAQDVTLLGGG